MPVLSDVVLIFLSSIVVLTSHDNFCVVPESHSVSGTMSVYYETYEHIIYGQRSVFFTLNMVVHTVT